MTLPDATLPPKMRGASSEAVARFDALAGLDTRLPCRSAFPRFRTLPGTARRADPRKT
jgi:hypothetical protein